MPRVSVLLWAAGALLLVLWTVFLVWGWHLPMATWAKVLPGFNRAESAFGPSPERWVPRVVAIILGLLTAILAGLALLVRYRETLQRPEAIARLLSAAVAVACCCVLVQNIVGRQVDQTYYNIQTMMTNPASVPYFGQRLLMIWPAMLLKHLVGRLTYIESDLLIQVVGIVLSVYVIGEWSALFVGQKLKFLGQIFLTVLLLPNMGALAFDIGVVFTYTFCFLFLYKRQYWLFGLAFCAGVLNHQNILLLVPTSVIVMWGRERRSTVAWVAALSLVAFFAIQFVLNQTVPVPRTLDDSKVWWNMRQIAELRRTMIFGIMLTIPWFVGAAAVWSAADPFLKRASILLPMQLGIYSIYGQLNEPRLFHGFLPILIGIYLCCIRDRFLGPEARLVPAPVFAASDSVP
jgi:hypothetical protein